jgi:hypothetical protein
MKCPNCRAPLDSSLLSRFSANAVVVGSFRCGSCGKSISAEQLKGGRRHGKWIVLAVAVIAATTVLWMLFNAE